MKYKIATVISYSSYHNSYIERVIEEAKKVSDNVIVVCYDHFFDGERDLEILSVDRFHELRAGVLMSLTNPDEIKSKPSRFWHNAGRQSGYSLLENDYDFVFFIDSDEVLEGDKVKLWLEEIVEPDQDYKLAHFWYYRDTCYRSRTPEEGAVLVSRKTLEDPDMDWFGDRERENFSTKWNYMASYKNKVLGHHYSWSGTKEMLMRKVKSWGHNEDHMDWEGMLKTEFSHEFNYHCPFKPYVFDKIEPYIGFTFNQN